MDEQQQLQELAETGEALMMLGESIRNWAKRGNLGSAKLCLAAAEKVAPDLLAECRSNVGPQPS